MRPASISKLGGGIAAAAARRVATSSRLAFTPSTSPIARRMPISTRAFTATAHVAKPSSPHVLKAAPITVEEYHELADKYLDVVQAKYEDMQDNDGYIDVEFSSGVMSIKMPNIGVYIVNKQPPNKQIWLSSPVSGPKRFDWVVSEEGGSGDWVYLRDGTKLTELLNKETGVEIPKTIE